MAVLLVAALFTAFVLAGAAAAGITPTATVVPTAPRFESAMPKGEGDTWRCLGVEPMSSFSPQLDCFVEVGALCITMGSVNDVDVGTGDGTMLGVVDGRDEDDEDEVASWDVDDGTEGMSNSAGRFRGVAWTLVMSLARSQ